MRRMWIKRLTAVLIVLALMTASYIVGWRNDTPAEKTLKTQRTSYDLLAPRLFVDNPNDSILSFSKLRKQLEDYTANIGAPTSLYFEYLPTGTSIETGNRNSFVAASLMKTPLALNLMKLSETGKIDLDKKVALKPEWLNSEFGTLYQKGAGYQLTLREAVAIMLEQSDNTAALMIQDALAKSPLPEQDDSLYSTDVTVDLNTEKRALITARSYSSIIQCLYFACYLNNTDSQELLGYLTKTPFTDRLTKGLPADVIVAHKIGTFTTTTQSDCGIIYVPKRNYSLCVFVDLPDPQGSKDIATISDMVYKYVTSL